MLLVKLITRPLDFVHYIYRYFKMSKSIARLMISTDWLTDWLTMSREHGHSSIYWTCLILSLSVAARSSEIPLSRVCLLHFMRRTVLILCGKTATWGIFKLKRPKTHIPLNIFMQVQVSWLFVLLTRSLRMQNMSKWKKCVQEGT